VPRAAAVPTTACTVAQISVLHLPWKLLVHAHLLICIFFGCSLACLARYTASPLPRCRRDLCGNWLSGVSPAG